ncbi:FAS-associated death domain protein [Cottoperca gobio]|uniref:FAS-associated death domain protein n=1 Tax=Cottoperca gobio TaxID=56716 RepID=A0A6J2RUI2_COTGO|nr:FAS-associated death domain protein [Cottoperca gobio]
MRKRYNCKLTDTDKQAEVKVKQLVFPRSDISLRRFSVEVQCVYVCVKDMSNLQFNSVLLDISNQLTDKQLEDMKFLCRDMVGKKELEKISSGIRLFQVLTERGKLGANNTDCLCQLLKDIHRQDLSGRIETFESPAGFNDNQPDKEERDKLDIATEVIVENMGRTWRKLGRRLGLTEVKLDSISRRHPTELEETTREMLKEWMKCRGAEARTEYLIDALRACQFNLTADKVQDRLL